MSATLTDRPSLNDYQLRLPSFEGPLDVLLRLVERSQLAITDVSLVAVTEQFLAHVAKMNAAPPETIAEFAAVAARLTVLKSRSLLPRPPVVAEEPDADELTKELRAYQRFKAAAARLAEWDAGGLGAFPPSQMHIERPAVAAPVRLAPMAPRALVHALKRRLTAAPRPVELRELTPMISLRTMVERVINAMRGSHELPFRRIASDDKSRHEVMTAFIAVLVLIRRRLIEADQTELFGEITLRACHRGLDAPIPLDELAADD